ncbi:MAG: hypothetical protein NZM44_06480 [Candidatus Calescibacterium sp.]|nr:hypothetical protein [Candidatus Calescibacterium sp.]
MEKTKQVILPYTFLQFNVLPFDIKEVTRLYDIVAKKDLNVVEDFLLRRVSEGTNLPPIQGQYPLSSTVKNFEFDLLLIETLKLYTDVVRIPSIASSNEEEEYNLKYVKLVTPPPENFYLPTIKRDYEIEKHLEKMFASHLKLIESPQEHIYEKTFMTYNVQISILIIKIYNLQREFENAVDVKTQFEVSKDILNLVYQYNQERPKIIDVVNDREIKPRIEMFSFVFNTLTGILRQETQESSTTQETPTTERKITTNKKTKKQEVN